MQAPAPTESFLLLRPDPAAQPAAAAGRRTDGQYNDGTGQRRLGLDSGRPAGQAVVVSIEDQCVSRYPPTYSVRRASSSCGDNWPSEHGCDVTSQLKLTDRRLTARLPSCRSTATTALYHLLARAAAVEPAHAVADRHCVELLHFTGSVN